MPETRASKAAQSAIDTDQDGTDPPLRRIKREGLGSFRVQKEGESDIRLPSSVYDGGRSAMSDLEDVTQHQKWLGAGYINRPGLVAGTREGNYRVPVDDDTYEMLEGGAGVGTSARLEEGQSFPEDISGRDKMLEKFPLPSYEEAARMQGQIDPIFEEMIAEKVAEKGDARGTRISERFGKNVGGVVNALRKSNTLVTSPLESMLDGLSDDEKDDLFQEAGREYLRRRNASQEAMEDTPAG